MQVVGVVEFVRAFGPLRLPSGGFQKSPSSPPRLPGGCSSMRSTPSAAGPHSTRCSRNVSSPSPSTPEPLGIVLPGADRVGGSARVVSLPRPVQARHAAAAGWRRGDGAAVDRAHRARGLRLVPRLAAGAAPPGGVGAAGDCALLDRGFPPLRENVVGWPTRARREQPVPRLLSARPIAGAIFRMTPNQRPGDSPLHLGRGTSEFHP